MTAIQWTDATWNPVIGCMRVSEGCRHCYAEVEAARVLRLMTEMEQRTGSKRARATGDAYWSVLRTDEHNRVLPRWNGKVRFMAERLDEPIKWKKPRRVFVNSMSDLFHGGVTNEQIAAIFGVMAASRQHTFQVLTKRPDRMLEWFDWLRGRTVPRFVRVQHPTRLAMAFEAVKAGAPIPDSSMLIPDWEMLSHGPWPLPNVWLGVSVEDQAAADERVPLLLQTPAAVRWVSAEPLLGPVRLRRIESSDPEFGDALSWNALAGTGSWAPMNNDGPKLDWVVVGGESGRDARPCDERWIGMVVNDCVEESVPVFVKQLGGPTDKRGKLEQMPEHLRVRQWPEVRP